MIRSRTECPTAVATCRPVCPTPLIGHHASIEAVHALVRKAGPTEASILITGETGTGKEVVARILHAQSRRAFGPFVVVNCGAIPSDILESELFGHARGAFTGALAARAGLFQTASHGTIFLDEIGDMPSVLQVKLLRVLQEREVRPVGLERSIKIDVRVIAATHKDLAQEITAGRFREDLYYRLNVIPIHLPELRNSRSDIPRLVEHFLDMHNRRHHHDVRITEQAVAQLTEYGWPGNVRELENVIERMVILSEDGVVRPTDLPSTIFATPPQRRIPDVAFGDGGVDLAGVVETYENGLIDQAMSRSGGNKQAAARLLGLNRTTLLAKLARRSSSAARPVVALTWGPFVRLGSGISSQAAA